jgi:hypothetical protein
MEELPEELAFVSEMRTERHPAVFSHKSVHSDGVATSLISDWANEWRQLALAHIRLKLGESSMV